MNSIAIHTNDYIDHIVDSTGANIPVFDGDNRLLDDGWRDPPECYKQHKRIDDPDFSAKAQDGTFQRLCYVTGDGSVGYNVMREALCAADPKARPQAKSQGAGRATGADAPFSFAVRVSPKAILHLLGEEIEVPEAEAFAMRMRGIDAYRRFALHIEKKKSRYNGCYPILGRRLKQMRKPIELR